MNSYAFGVDIGGTTVKLGLFSGTGELLEKWEIPTDIQDNGTRILPHVVRAISDKMTQKNIAAEQVAGIGFGFPGPVTAEGVVTHCDNLGLSRLDVKATMAQLMPSITNIAVENDANVAALGELRQGGGKGYSSAVMFTLGTGVGGGVVLDGAIYSGTNGAAGEVGHLTVEPDETVPCGCGKCGCLEQYASANGIVRLAKRMLAACDTPSQLRQMESFTAKDVCDLARDGEEMASAILDRCGQYLGLAMSYVSCTVDPQVYIVGGGMSRAGTILTDAIQKHYHKFAYHPSKQTPIVSAELGNDAGICGCAGMVLGNA